MRTKPMPLPAVEYLWSVFDYNPETGILRWKSPRPRVVVGSEVGWVHVQGRRELELDGVGYKVHRIIWKMMTGRDPNPEVDHRNLIRDDNRWDNLREASWAQNARNRSIRSDSKNKYKGVRCDKRYGLWCARIQMPDGKRREFGWFHTPEEAYAIYCVKAAENFGEFARFK